MEALLMLACMQTEGGAVDRPRPRPGLQPDDSAATLAFDGVRRAAWDKADGIDVEWEPASGGSGPLTYTLRVARDTDVIAELESSGTRGSVQGLADGLYEVSVEAADSDGNADDGSVRLSLWVGRNRLQERGTVSLSGVADVWGQGTTVVVAGYETGRSLFVVDARDPDDPQVIEEIWGEGYVKDVKIGDGLLFSNDESGTYGARVWDFEDPSSPRLLARIGSPSRSVHNLSYGDGHLYASNNDTDGMDVWNVEDPENPVRVDHYDPPWSFVHDQAWVDGKVYVAWWGGFTILDATDPSDLVAEVVHAYSDSTSACHNVWPTEDGRHVLTTDEETGGHVRVFDVSDPEDVRQVGSYRSGDGTVVHNVHVDGDHAFVAYYTEGVRVLDVSDPTSPKEVGSLDTLARHGEMYGAWGVWPYGEHIAIGDTRNGLILATFHPPVVRAP